MSPSSTVHNKRCVGGRHNSSFVCIKRFEKKGRYYVGGECNKCGRMMCTIVTKDEYDDIKKSNVA